MKKSVSVLWGSLESPAHPQRTEQSENIQGGATETELQLDWNKTTIQNG